MATLTERVSLIPLTERSSLLLPLTLTPRNPTTVLACLGEGRLGDFYPVTQADQPPNWGSDPLAPLLDGHIAPDSGGGRPTSGDAKC